MLTLHSGGGRAVSAAVDRTRPRPGGGRAASPSTDATDATVTRHAIRPQGHLRDAAILCRRLAHSRTGVIGAGSRASLRGGRGPLYR
jgi:hypothetical protein